MYLLHDYHLFICLFYTSTHVQIPSSVHMLLNEKNNMLTQIYEL